MKKAVFYSLSFLAVFLATNTAFAWTNPASNPTGGSGVITVEGGSPASSIYVKSNGNIGIGNTNPTGLFHVVANNNDLFSIVEKTGVGGQHAVMQMITRTTGNPFAYNRYDAPGLAGSPYWQAGIFGIDGGANYSINYQNSPKLYITTAGKVGIGTTGPTTALEVNGTVKATAFEGTSTGAASAANVSSGAFGANTGGGNYSFPAKLGIGVATPAGQLGNFGSNVLDQAGVGLTMVNNINWTDGAPGYVLGISQSSTASNAMGALIRIAGTAATNKILALNSNGTDRLVVQGDGSVGIGTNSPSYRLTVVKDVAGNVDPISGFLNPSLPDGSYIYNATGKSVSANNAALFGFTQNATASKAWMGLWGDDVVGGVGLTVLKGGNVGIGTNNPRFKLELNGQLISTAAYNTNTYIGQYDIGVNTIGVATSLYSYASICAQNASGLCNGSGGVVIGGANTSATVNIPATGSAFFNGGNVGIGTNAPGYKLDVNGTANLPKIFINRSATTGTGISWYNPGYTSWAEYMCPAGATGCGATANITAPTGSLVTTWGLHSFIENGAGYGWTFESGTSTGQPTVVAEIRSSDGAAKFNGSLTVGGNSNTCHLVSYSGGTTACPAGYYTWSGQALASGYMLCCKVDNPI